MRFYAHNIDSSMLAMSCLSDRIFFKKAEDILPNTTVSQKACGRGPDKDSEAELICNVCFQRLLSILCYGKIK